MPPISDSPPRIFIAGLRGGAGKTTLSLGIIAALRRAGRSVAPFKKGPDYIDAGWLALAAGRPCYNLDTFLVPPAEVLGSFLVHTRPGDIAVIEGNRGLYDGIDPEGRTSSAEVAKLLGAPVVLCIDATKMTRTAAAVISGCTGFDPEVRLRGVILNRVAGPRHENILRECIEHHCGIPVLGAVPKLDAHHFPERHMGLVPTPEHAGAVDALAAAAAVAERYLDLDALARIAAEAGPMPDWPRPESAASVSAASEEPRPRVGVLRDAAFQFYYPDNIEALNQAGAETVFIDALADRRMPPLDGLYIGGGFPETHAAALGENRALLRDIREGAEAGLPVYAECGGLMYLGEALVIEGRTYPMSGVLPVVFGLAPRPQGLGYTVVEVERENPYFPVGTELRGHEFRYSKVLEWRGEPADMVFGMKRGTGFAGNRDGIRHKRVFATYTHIHALGVPGWAPALVANARAYRDGKPIESWTG
jgi:cobyrinic acid a,c-diamide synthase